MIQRLGSKILVASSLAIAGVALAGCSTTATISQDSLNSAVTAQAEANYGADGPQLSTVDCANSIEAKVGATTTCDLTFEGTDQTAVATITVTDASNLDKVAFDISVTENP